MKKSTSKWITILTTGAALSLPQTGAGVGHITVYARDTGSSGTPPPLSTATLNGSSTLSFGTNSTVTFSNVPAGTHTVEVVTATSGYLPCQSPNTPNAINDPNSSYGNPRFISLSDDELASVTFRFDPVITASATVRDAWTMNRLDEASIRFFPHSSTNVTLQKYPWSASYASNWQSRANGSFPTNTILYLDSYNMEISCAGYQTFTSSNTIVNASVGDAFDLGDIFLLPPDSNTNLIDDLWETIYFGEGSNVIANADADGDGVCNRDEYVAGTDPTNTASVLLLTHSISNSTMELTWNTEPCRTYRLIGTTDLSTGTWVQVAGPWEAASNQTGMVWVETNMHLSWKSYYCADVVPCTWTGTNQVLICTNDWPTGGGGGSGGGWTNGPPTP